MIRVGRIIRPQGNRGEVVVDSSTDFGEERFRLGAGLFLERDGSVESVRVRASREHDGRWVIALDGVDTIDRAESLRGRELRIPAGEIQALEPGRYYVHDLVGCRVETTTGRALGAVKDVRLDTGVPLLVVEGERGEVLVPFTEAFCRRVDPAARIVVIEPPDGLVELNEPGARD